MPNTPTPGEIWRHREKGWTAAVFEVLDSPPVVALHSPLDGRSILVPIPVFQEHFERLEAPDDGA